MTSKPPFAGEKISLIEVAQSLESGKREKGGALKEGIPSLGGEHLTKFGTIDWTPKKMKYISQNFFSRMRQGKLQVNDVLIVKDGATTGKTAFVDSLPFAAAINEHVFLLRFESLLRAKYVAYYLMSAIGQKEISNYYKGSAIGGIDRSFADMKLWFYDDVVTTEIVTTLDLIRTQLFRFEMVLQRLDKLIKSRFVEIFGDGKALFSNWQIRELADCVRSIDSGNSPNCKNVARTGIEPGVLKLSAISSGVFLPAENKAMMNHEKMDRSKEIHKGDILITRKNTPDLVGTCVLVRESVSNLMFPDLVFRMHPIGKVNAEYLVALLGTSSFSYRVRALAHGSAKSMSNIPKSDFAKLRIPLPPFDMQQQFADFVAKVDKSRFVVQRQIEKLQTLYDSLAQEYFGD